MLLYTKNVLIVVGCIGFSLHAMENRFIKWEDHENHIYQVESLNQLDPQEGEFSKTACGYYAFNNCIKIMEMLMASFKKNTTTGSLRTISEKFSTIDSEQRQFIFTKRLIVEIQDLLTNELQKSALYKSFTNKEDQESLIKFLRLIINELSSSKKSAPLLKEGVVTWVFQEKNLISSFQAVCKKNSSMKVCFIQFSQKIGAFFKVDSCDSCVISPLLWSFMAKLLPQVISYENNQLSFSFHGTSSIVKKTGYGNDLDSDDITSLIDNFGDAEEKKIEVLNMAGSFMSSFKEWKLSAERDKTILTPEVAIRDYVLCNYHKLEEVRETLLTTEEDVIAGFIIHTFTEAVEEPGGIFAYIVPQMTTANSDHWISLVVVRQDQGYIRYYVADSYHNKNRLNSSLVHDIKKYLEDKKCRTESPFYIPELSFLETLSTSQFSTPIMPKRSGSTVVPKGGGPTDFPMDEEKASLVSLTHQPPVSAGPKNIDSSVVLKSGSSSDSQTPDSQKNEENSSLLSSTSITPQNSTLAALALIGSGAIYLFSVDRQKNSTKKEDSKASKKPRVRVPSKVTKTTDESHDPFLVATSKVPTDSLRKVDEHKSLDSLHV